jgi:D-sedoheptulose 7-phosphate isomerase
VSGPAIDATGRVRAYLEASAAVKRRLLDEGGDRLEALGRIGEAVAAAFQAGKKVLICGNGGSAADAQHIATEWVVRLRRAPARRALPAIALTTDSSVLTAGANDLSFDEVFARQVEALGAPGDVLIAISTSGGSPNVVRALEAAGRAGMTRVFFGGGDGGRCKALAEHAFVAPSTSTSHIQEVHLAAYHAMLFLVEELLFGPAPE